MAAGPEASPDSQVKLSCYPCSTKALGAGCVRGHLGANPCPFCLCGWAWGPRAHTGLLGGSVPLPGCEGMNAALPVDGRLVSMQRPRPGPPPLAAWLTATPRERLPPRGSSPGLAASRSGSLLLCMGPVGVCARCPCGYAPSAAHRDPARPALSLWLHSSRRTHSPREPSRHGEAQGPPSPRGRPGPAPHVTIVTAEHRWDSRGAEGGWASFQGGRPGVLGRHGSLPSGLPGSHHPRLACHPGDNSPLSIGSLSSETARAAR